MSEENKNKLLIQNPEDIKRKLEENLNKIKAKPELEKKESLSSLQKTNVEQTTIAEDIQDIRFDSEKIKKEIKTPIVKEPQTMSSKVVDAGVELAVGLTKAILLLVGGFILLIFILAGLCVLALKN